MQPSTPFDWGRVVTPLRWTIRVLSVLWAVILAYVLVRATMADSEITGTPPDVLPSAVPGGVIVVGLLLAIFWTGIGEVIGGLVTIGAVVGLTVWSGPSALVPFGAFIIFGALFIVCGWYTLAQRSRRAMPTAA